jgi:hypothetical protein
MIVAFVWWLGNLSIVANMRLSRTGGKFLQSLFRRIADGLLSVASGFAQPLARGG